jgi:hypothetical protein
VNCKEFVFLNSTTGEERQVDCPIINDRTIPFASLLISVR